MQQVLQQAQKLQQQMLEAQEELTRTRVEGSAGGGLVRATVTGGGELIGLQISRDAVDPEDPETLADLVLAAVRDANARAGELAEKTMGPLTQGLGGVASGLGLPDG
jgi:DNA-binding YbaB/EbfC family protein